MARRVVIRVNMCVPDEHKPDCPSPEGLVTTIEGDRAVVTAYHCSGCPPRPWEDILADIHGGTK